LCKTTAGCVSFSFDLFNSAHACSLHSGGASSAPSTSAISGSTVQPAPSPHHSPAPKSPAPAPAHIPAPHHTPSPGTPGPPLPKSFSDVPGISYAGIDNSVFGRGFDPIADESKQPVVLFTTSQNPERLWAPPQYEGLDIVHVPNQVSVFTLPANQYQAQGSYLFDYAEVESFSNSSTTSVVSEILYHSFSTTFYQSFKYLLDVNDSVADYSGQHITLFKAALWSAATLRDEMGPGGSQNMSAFARAQERLPLSRNSVDERASYKTFLGTFGTHYVTSAAFGGSVHAWVSASQNYALNESSSEYYEDSETALNLLFYKFGRVSENSVNTSSLSRSFKRNASMIVEILGGDPTSVNTNFSSWAAGVYLAPVPINVTYGNVSDLIRNPFRRQLFREAVEEYISSAKSTANTVKIDSSIAHVNMSSHYYPWCTASLGRKVPFDEKLTVTATLESGSLDCDDCTNTFARLDGATCDLTQGHQFGGVMVATNTASSAAECCQQCRKNAANCAFFDYDTLGNTCRQLKTKDSDVVSLMHIGGARTSAPPAPSTQPTPSPSSPTPQGPAPQRPSPSISPSPAPSKLPLLPVLKDGTSKIGHFFRTDSGTKGGACVASTSYHEAQSWLQPSSKSGKPIRFALPDGFSLEVPSASCLKSSTSVTTTASDVVASNLLSTRLFPYLGLDNPEADMGIESASGLFGAQQENASAATNKFSKHIVSFEVSFVTHIVRFDMNNRHIDLESSFAKSIAELDANSKHTEEFMTVVEQYGGSYVAEESFGGYCNFQASYDASSAKAKGVTMAQARQMALKRLDADLFQALGVPVAMNEEVIAARKSKETSDSFYKSLSPSFVCTGGNVSLLPKVSNIYNPSLFDGVFPFETWLDSLVEYAMVTDSDWVAIPHSVRLRSIADAIEDPGTNRVLWLATLNNLAVAGKRTIDEAISHANALEAENARQQGHPNGLRGFVSSFGDTSKISPFHGATLPSQQNWAAGSIVSTVTGVCNGNGDVGIGCGYDSTELELFGTTINPKKPVISLASCPARCYTNPPPITSECTYCTYQSPGSGAYYRVPSNVYVADAPISGGCYEVSAHHDFESYQSAINSAYLTAHGHTSKSKYTRKIMQRFYERDDSLSLMYKYLIWHSVQLVDTSSPPTYDFLMATLDLPVEYDANIYKSFIQDFGTHIMTKAYMGGAALLTTYFHKCFLEMYDAEYVTEETRSHYWFHYKDGSKYSNSSVNMTRWDEWSQTELVLMGGDAWSHGELEPNPVPPGASNTSIPHPTGPKISTLNQTDVEAWEESIAGNKVIPLAAELLPLATYMAGWAEPAIVANVNRTISDYYTSIQEEQRNIVNELVPKDPHIVPKWCKPPTGKLRDKQRSSVSTSERRELLSENALPIGCPALPSGLEKDVLEVYMQRKDP
jgi:hypothetical protein